MPLALTVSAIILLGIVLVVRFTLARAKENRVDRTDGDSLRDLVGRLDAVTKDFNKYYERSQKHRKATEDRGNGRS